MIEAKANANGKKLAFLDVLPSRTDCLVKEEWLSQLKKAVL